jgi:hypothetical protein
MLDRSTRKKLLEHNWLEVARKDSNPSQTPQRLPEKKQEEIFSYTNVNKLLKAILKSTGTSDNDARRTQLAGLLVKLGIWICIEQYRSKVEQDSDLNSLTINHLVRARDICDAISFRLRKPKIEEEAKKEKLVYLFNWSRIRDVHEVREIDIQDNDTRKFVDFLQEICIEEFGVPFDIVNKIWGNINSDASDIAEYTEIQFESTPVYGGYATGMVRLDSKNKTGQLFMEVWDGVKTRKAQRDLVIKVENEDVYVYRNQ